MEGPFSKTVFSRLPSPIKELDETAQKLYIFLRLRKSESEISKRLGISMEELKAKADSVRHALAKSGMLYLIDGHRTVSVDGGDGGERTIVISSEGIGLDEKVMLHRFIEALRETVRELPQSELVILKLKYRDGLSAHDIVEFFRKVGSSPVAGKSVDDLTTQDIYGFLSSIMLKIVRMLKVRCEDWDLNASRLKEIFEEIGV